MKFTIFYEYAVVVQVSLISHPRYLLYTMEGGAYEQNKAVYTAASVAEGWAGAENLE